MLRISKENFFEITIALGLLVSGLLRLTSPEARAAEQREMPFQRPEIEWLITGYELAGPAVIFLAPKPFVRAYLMWFFLCIVALGLYHLVTAPTTPLKGLEYAVIYTGDTKSLVIHYFVAIILLYVLFLK